MDRFPQPPDPPEEGNCRRCKAWIGGDELLTDGCTECDDLLIDDMAKLWAGRPKCKKLSIQNCPVYAFDNSGRVGWMVFIHPAHYRPKDWRGLI